MGLEEEGVEEETRELIEGEEGFGAEEELF